MPLIIGFVVSRTLAEPTFVLMERFNPEFFELSDRQKVEGAHEVHVHELRLRMGSAIGRAPPLDGELQALACAFDAVRKVGFGWVQRVLAKPTVAKFCCSKELLHSGVYSVNWLVTVSQAVKVMRPLSCFNGL